MMTKSILENKWASDKLRKIVTVRDWVAIGNCGIAQGAIVPTMQLVFGSLLGTTWIAEAQGLM